MSEYKVIMESGSVYPITRKQRDYILQKSKLVGGNFPYFELKDPDVVIFYKHISEFVIDEYEEDVAEPTPVVVKEQVAEPTEDSDDAEIEAKRAKLLEEMMAKSSCKHEEQSLYFITTKSSKGKVTNRYFPVCDFCGQRFKFVKAADCADEDKENAKEWVDTE